MYFKSQFLAFLSLFFIFQSCSSETVAPKSPNIIFILADDLGYGELGSYGQTQIETPNLDALRSSGMKFTQHYTGAPVCAPARAILMSGQHSGHVHVRGNDEWSARGKVWDFAAMQADSSLEGQRPLPADTITIAEVLQANGYQTACIGKWGLGAPGTEGTPNKQGFDFFYGYNCQRQAHTFYPVHLWKNDQRIFLNNELVPPHRTPLVEDADSLDINAYAQYNQNDYSATLMQQEALDFISRNQDNPFFLYYATPLPHVALQAPKRWVDHYVEKFGDEAPYLGRGYFPCRYPRATYAAMISYLDEQVGELVAHLKQLGIEENTLIVFTSDNGPTYAGGVEAGYFDNAQPFKSEHGWGKGFVREGGIRVPTIAAWPGKIEPGSTTDHISAFWDFFPTFAEVAKAALPTSQRLDGISLLPTLLGETQQKHDFLYWEFPETGGQQALRMGPWKGVILDMNKGNTEMELYNLEKDPREQHNLAAEYPELVDSIRQIMASQHTPAVIDRWKIKCL
ncbi:MAG: arylsulfatase, partial [Bacteroidota bacterium]